MRQKNIKQQNHYKSKYVFMCCLRKSKDTPIIMFLFFYIFNAVNESKHTAGGITDYLNECVEYNKLR